MNKYKNVNLKDKGFLSKRNNTNIIIKEAREEVNVIEVRGHSNGFDFNLIMDSGASRDHISEKLVKMLNLKKCQN